MQQEAVKDLSVNESSSHLFSYLQKLLDSFSNPLFFIYIVSSEVEMNRTWTDNINLFQTLQLYARLDIKHQIRFNKLD